MAAKPMSKLITYVHVTCILALLTGYVHSSPIKRSTYNECFYTYHGTGCIDNEAVVDVNLPQNITETLMETLPGIQDNQKAMAAQMERQEDQIRNLTSTVSTMAVLLDNSVRLLDEIVERLPTPFPPARDCQDIALRGPHESGTYTITPDDKLDSFPVYCQFDHEGTAWTVFQRRFDGSVDFYRGWQEYEEGFGSPDGEYWMGLRQIYSLVKKGKWVLRIDLSGGRYVLYDSFTLGDISSNYSLSIGSFSAFGNYKFDDSLRPNENMGFSTFDRYNNIRHDINCAQVMKGAWWYNYKTCSGVNLNGVYRYRGFGNTDRHITYMAWGEGRSLEKVVMKLRHAQ